MVFDSDRSSISDSISSGPSKSMIKIYTKVLCSDIEYKTLSITEDTTCNDMVRMLLHKFRLKHTDPNLFYVAMEVIIRKTGIPIRSVVVLDDMSCPAQIQASYPHQDTKFTLMMKRGGLVKVYDSCLMSSSLYKSLLISDVTTVGEVIQLLLQCYDSDERPSKFALYEVCPQNRRERKLRDNELLLRLQQEWPLGEVYCFQLRRNYFEQSHKRKALWIRSSIDPIGLSCCSKYSKELSSLIYPPLQFSYLNTYPTYFYV
ncbi:uncharacterized protein LOC107368015 [Tetranychus urticae]|uniref:uncharacterized protein LOC107368015 n=1 Tax=Tetranychus urticae TaxID=32264 RepID=UPI00077BAE12|nr:uncharacterized protein LOC107368015 [Tetranychus urticae]